MVILNWVIYELISSHLWSWWNVCWGVFLITWCLVFRLTVVHLVLMSINIGTSWIDWRSFVASLSTSWWLSRVWFDVLLAWLDPWWLVSISSIDFVVIASLRRYLSASLDRWLDSRISLALKSWLWCFGSRFDSKLVEINSVLFDLILSNCWKLVSFLKILHSFWLCVRDCVGVFHIELL